MKDVRIVSSLTSSSNIGGRDENVGIFNNQKYQNEFDMLENYIKKQTRFKEIYATRLLYPGWGSLHQTFRIRGILQRSFLLKCSRSRLD
jgi:hypothetical protein